MNQALKIIQSDDLIKTALKKCKSPNHWDLSNRMLYDLCERYPHHQDPEEIVAKVLMIGRVYAVALERIKTKIQINDDFYLEAIVPLFKNSELDERLASLRNRSFVDRGIFEETLKVHSYLVKLIGKLEGTENYLKKRSFASKYLHFHCPELFFIFDSRAQNAMTLFDISPSAQIKELLTKYDLDTQYVQFADRCRQLKDQIRLHGIALNNRELDNILVDVANERLKKRSKTTGKITAVSDMMGPS